ncbi:MAG: sigma-54-dependent transcriptional regulator [Saprospiraceae bacterium]
MKMQDQPIKIFVVEDDPMYNRMVKYIMELNPDHEVFSFTTGKECLENLHLGPSIISLDYSLPDMTGEDVLRKIKSFNKDIVVVILSGQQDIATAVKLLKEGAYDYITKDNETKERLLNTVSHVKSNIELKEEVEILRDELTDRYQFDKSIIGNSKPMQRVYSLMKKAIRTNISVSITGETGTGKEVIAKSIHYNSDKKKQPFVAVNMSAIPDNLLESELFGYEKGAFTGANTRKIGKFEQANKGTLFLDEVAEMDISLQAKLLRALQEREVNRIGGDKPIKFDARIIVATHKNLAEEVNSGNFREDLYYRLLGLPVELPPLRDRGNDIVLLAKSFLDAFIKQNKMPKMDISKNAKQRLLEYSYPGNVRELKAVIELSAVMASSNTIDVDDIHFNSPKKTEAFLTEETTLKAYTSKIIHHFLKKYDDNVLLVAKKLDIGKSTIYRMLKEEKEVG